MSDTLARWGVTLTLLLTLPALGLLFGGIVGLIVGLVIGLLVVAGRS